MKILLCSVPDGADKPSKPLIPRGQTSVLPIFPLGIQRVLSSIQEHGYDGEIYDINNLRHSDEEIISNLLKTKPDVIGLSGPLSHCYPHLKRIAKLIRKNLPNSWIIVGGNVTGSAHILLNKTETDLTVIGDGEIPFLKLLKFFEKNLKRDFSKIDELLDIPGLAFLDTENKFQFTGFAEQLPAHKMGFPDYEIWEDGLEKFGGNRNLVLDVFDQINSIGDLVGLAEERSHRTKEYIDLFNKYKEKEQEEFKRLKDVLLNVLFVKEPLMAIDLLKLKHSRKE